MERKIREWWNKYATIARVEIALCVVFGIMHACIGNVASALVWVCCIIAWFCCDMAEQRYKRAYNIGIELGKINDEVIEINVQITERLKIEEEFHFFTMLQMRAYQNDVAFCKREKSCSEYISYKQCIEDAIAEAVEKLRKMCKEYKDKYGEDYV